MAHLMLYFVLALSAVELFFLGFGLHALFVIIARSLFSFKLLGMDVRIGWPLGFDLAAILMTLLWRLVWKNELFDLEMTVMLVAMFIIFICAMYDQFGFVYVEEDDYSYIEKEEEELYK